MKNILALITLLASLAWAQHKPERPTPGESIWLGNTELQLGLPKETVISRLAEHYKLVKVPPEGEGWLVESEGTQPAMLGQVLFDKGKLVLAARDWTSGDEDSFAIAQAFYGAFDQFAKEGKHACKVDAHTNHSQGVESGFLTFYCGGSKGAVKRLVVTTTEVFSGEQKGKSVSIQEVLLYENN